MSPDSGTGGRAPGCPGAVGTGGGPMRLDRFVSQAAGVSRSQARALIQRGQVSVDGDRVRDPSLKIGDGSLVAHRGEPLRLSGPVYLMLHKPVGLLSATRDAGQATVLSLLPAGLAARVHLVGRLDKDTSGLLLLSDDGAWSHRIASPRHHCPKVYLATLAEPLDPAAEGRLAQGILLRGEDAPTRPAEVQRLDDQRVRITVTEGRYHLVRRLFAALGNRVLALHRERIGGLVLDGALAPGQWRTLTPEERAAVSSG